MARAPQFGTRLRRLFDQLATPIYVIDDAHALVFCNAACLRRFDVEASEMIDQVCRYEVPSDRGAENLANGLAPPPYVWEGSPAVAQIAIPARSGRVVQLPAVFLPLPLRDETPPRRAVMAIVDAPWQVTFRTRPRPVDAEKGPPPAEEDDDLDSDREQATLLHEILQRHGEHLGTRFGPARVVARSPAMQRAARQVTASARSAASTVLVGPQGSGREHLARVIHYAERQTAPGTLIPLECAVLPEEIILSTVDALLGRGAPRRGVRPDVSLLLGDVDYLASALQRPLVERLAPTLGTVHLLATSTRMLDELAAQGQFDRSLADLLTTVVIEVPPLAERQEDIALLAQTLLEQRNAESEKQIAGFTASALEYLHSYGWPGNVAELAEVVDLAHDHASDAMIRVGDLPRDLIQAADATGQRPAAVEPLPLEATLAAVERELIRHAVEVSRGNKAKAARLLHLTRPKLYRRMEQLGLLEDDAATEP